MRIFLLCLAIAMLIPIGASRAWAASTSGPYSVELLDENGGVLPTFWKGGQTYILGAKGQRYALRIRNQSGARVEFVASVDGRDVLDGNTASFDKRGYIVAPWDQVVIDGFRLDHESVAAFRFSSVKDSYAARMGEARDVGVIGVAVFPERQVRYQPPLRPRSYVYEPSPAGLGAGASADAAKSVAPAAAPPSEARASTNSLAKMTEKRPGLGTEFGEQRSSHVDEVAFERASTTPPFVLSVRYNDRAGLRAMGVNVDPTVGPREVELRETAQPFPGNFCAPPPGWGR